ncbi:MAG: bacteriohemerythrin [Desulfuromonas sp.]|nr:bacteriohemerythrin [Desulfuromonas sp.]
MPLFIWKPSYEMGVPEIDLEHRQLVGTINELFEAMKTGQGREIMDQILDRLIDYAEKHFDNEESFMRAANYPGMPSHEQEHQRFRAHVLEMDMSRRAGKFPPSIELLTYLSDWLREHVTTADKEMGRHLKKPQY